MTAYSRAVRFREVPTQCVEQPPAEGMAGEKPEATFGHAHAVLSRRRERSSAMPQLAVRPSSLPGREQEGRKRRMCVPYVSACRPFQSCGINA